MAPTFPGRYAAQSDQPFVVLFVGMRINRIFALGSWRRIAAAMHPMIAELKPDSSLGLLHARFFFDWRGVGLLQDSPGLEQLDACAHARNAAHLPAGAEFNRSIGGNGSAGIGQETYAAAAGQYESMVDRMPHFGLGAAVRHLPRTGRLDTARPLIGRSKSAEDPTEQP
jgi:Domain of unknown function (DUF4188)